MNFSRNFIFIGSIILSLVISENFALYANDSKYNVLGLGRLDANFNTPQGHELESAFDVLRGFYRTLRGWFFALLHRDSPSRLGRLGKLQRKVPADEPFPCELNFTRSTKPPTSVHELRPGDIDIIAAMGDSVTAGTCLMADYYVQFPIEYRSKTFSGGGYGTWRTYLTLPNILKVFNPKLYGYTIADSITAQRESRFNVAEPAAMSRDLVYQAKLIMQRMRQDPNVDMEHHWKMVTIFIGNLDICEDFCTHKNMSMPLSNHAQDLYQSLALLRDNIPRLYVNFLPAPSKISMFEKTKAPPLVCYMFHRFCFCEGGENTETDREAYKEKIRIWQDLDAYITNLDEFNTDNFTVVFHPFFVDVEIPLLPDGSVDQRYFAIDCFHFSQFGQAALANILWNSMMQPVGHKQHSLQEPFKHFECPTLERPYLATTRNSLSREV